MNDIATHLRITNLTYTNDDVTARKAAVVALKTAWTKANNSVEWILTQSSEVARSLVAAPSKPFGAEVQTIVQKKAAAFVAEDRPLEVGIMAGLAAAEIIAGAPGTTGWQVGDVWAAGLWSALQFQVPLSDPKREDLRTYLREQARSRAVVGAEVARQRIPVPDFKSPAAEAETPFRDQFGGLTKDTVDALRRNSALDREELDFLWWSLADRSRLLKRPLSRLPAAGRAIAAAVDASMLLRRLPCEVHRELVLRSLDENLTLDLPEMLNALGDDRAQLAAPFSEGVAVRIPTVFPLLRAMVNGQPQGEASSIKRTIAEWAARALLEGTLAQLSKHGPGTL